MENKGIHMLVALSNIDDDTVKQLIIQLKEHGVPITKYGLKFRKSTVEDYLLEHQGTDVLLVSEMLEMNNGYVYRDYERLVENNPNLCIIPILMDAQKGKPYIKEIFNLGIFNAIYNDDAGLEQVAKIIIKNRTRKEARFYYGLDSMQSTIIEEEGADISACIRTIVRASNKVQAAHHILERVTEDEFKNVLSKLPKDVLSSLQQSDDILIQPYFTECESKSENKLGGLLKRFTGKRGTSSKEVDTSKEKPIKEHTEVELDVEENFVVDVSDIFPAKESEKVNEEKGSSKGPEQVLEEKEEEVTKEETKDTGSVVVDEPLQKSESVHSAEQQQAVEQESTEQESEYIKVPEDDKDEVVESNTKETTTQPIVENVSKKNYANKEHKHEQEQVKTQQQYIDTNEDTKGSVEQKKAADTYNRDLILETLIGVVGIKSGVGVTFQAILLARYFASLGKNVALVEQGQSSVFSSIESCYPIEKVSDTSFKYQGITFYKKSEERINCIYDVIVTDYGCYRDEIKDVCLNSLDLFIVSGGLAWENIALGSVLSEIIDKRTSNVFARSTYALFRGNIDQSIDLPSNYIVLPTISNPFESQLCDEMVLAVGGTVAEKQSKAESNVTTQQATKRGIDNQLEHTKAQENEQPVKGIGSLFGKKIFKDTKSAIPNDVTDSKNSDSKPKEKRIKQSDVKGTCSVFVTSLRSGCGATHVSETIANYMTVRGKTALISNKPNSTLELSKGVTVYETYDISTVPEVFSANNNVVMDMGIFTDLSMDNLLECKRSSVKVMVCWGSSSYLESLAQFIEKEADEAEKWIYVFNNVPDTQIRSIKKLMNYYTCCFMPIYGIGDMPSTVKNICKEILNI